MQDSSETAEVISLTEYRKTRTAEQILGWMMPIFPESRRKEILEKLVNWVFADED